MPAQGRNRALAVTSRRGSGSKTCPAPPPIRPSAGSRRCSSRRGRAWLPGGRPRGAPLASQVSETVRLIAVTPTTKLAQPFRCLRNGLASDDRELFQFRRRLERRLVEQASAQHALPPQNPACDLFALIAFPMRRRAPAARQGADAPTFVPAPSFRSRRAGLLGDRARAACRPRPGAV